MRKYFKNDIIRLAKPINQTPHIYFLLQDEEIVYVGYSINVACRIDSHTKDKTFNKTFTIPTNVQDGPSLEKHYIKAFNPLYNRLHASHEVDFKTRTGKIETPEPVIEKPHAEFQPTNEKYNLPLNSYVKRGELIIIRTTDGHFTASSNHETYFHKNVIYKFRKVFGSLQESIKTA